MNRKWEKKKNQTECKKAINRKKRKKEKKENKIGKEENLQKRDLSKRELQKSEIQSEKYRYTERKNIDF